MDWTRKVNPVSGYQNGHGQYGFFHFGGDLALKRGVIMRCEAKNSSQTIVRQGSQTLPEAMAKYNKFDSLAWRK